MAIFKLSGDKLVPQKSSGFDLERKMQRLVEDNLSDVFGLEFVATEFSRNNLRIDTLAFDEETKSFVIIEYKLGESFSVIDQGFAYLAQLLNNKEAFILKYQEKFNTLIRINEVDWSQSRVIFIANNFTKYQREAIAFRDIPIELWQISRHGDDAIEFSRIQATDKDESFKTIIKDKKLAADTKEINPVTMEDHYKHGSDHTRELFEELSQRILELNTQIQLSPTKTYVGFKLGSKVVVDVDIKKHKLQLALLRVKPEDLQDPQNRVFYVPGSMENWNKHVSRIFIENEQDIEYAMTLVKQVYEKFFK